MVQCISKYGPADEVMVVQGVRSRGGGMKAIITVKGVFSVDK